MWVGPHRDLEEEAEEDATRHNDAVREQRRLPAAHQAFVRFDQDEPDHVDGLIEDDPDFGPYYAHCEDCHGDVSLGRMAEDEAASEARQHRDAFAALDRCLNARPAGRPALAEVSPDRYAPFSWTIEAAAPNDALWLLMTSLIRRRPCEREVIAFRLCARRHQWILLTLCSALDMGALPRNEVHAFHADAARDR